MDTWGMEDTHLAKHAYGEVPEVNKSITGVFLQYVWMQAVLESLL